ncbi:uncharacterized protein LOC103388112 isoform X2 [Cynoglossus semilaevis]|uniref:uncharacterized protein LOC103388112 isoform X2 n=1 Tax=Cynoglossus semilaevis TaxID=244447 RepID=UPI000497D0CD|nr:uncharacterized protein LOC103388112 isoform X2 [Cynoglossus semilaevis]
MTVLMMVVFLELLVLITGVVPQSVILPPAVCAMTHSTVTLGCSFTPRITPIVRVRWCKDHPLCHKTTPTVYDSNRTKSNSRFLYLGDKTSNCTLQIQNLLKPDNGTYRFRMEATEEAGHFTNQTGVQISVKDQTVLSINTSSDNGEMFEGQDVTLRCTAPCTFYDLKVTWLKDDHTLSETSPTLHISPLTAGDSGNYSCSLKKSLSHRYQLQVTATGQQSELPLILGVTLGVSVVLCGVILVFIFKRKPAAVDDHQAATAMELEPQQYANINRVLQIC